MEESSRRHIGLKKIIENLARSFEIPGMLEWAQSIEDPLDYRDPSARQSVIERNISEMKKRIAMLEKISNRAAEHSFPYVENPGNFSYEEWEKLQHLKEDIAEYQRAIEQEPKEEPLQRPVAEKKRKKIGSYRGWIPS